jgi:hypothetical protein
MIPLTKYYEKSRYIRIKDKSDAQHFFKKIVFFFFFVFPHNIQISSEVAPMGVGLDRK